MIAVTIAAIAKLKAIQVHHPEDPVIRISVRDLNDSCVRFNITLETNTQSDDDVQQIDGRTIAVDRRSGPRMEGVTVDYTEAEGFRFLHNEEGRSLPFITIPTLINGSEKVSGFEFQVFGERFRAS